MASVRGRRNTESNIWPGFVDAMTALLLILIFVLSIFMIVQMVLRDTVTGQEKELAGLSGQVADLASSLGLEQQHVDELESEVGLLDAQLDEAVDEAELQAALVASLTRERDEANAEIGQLRAANAAEVSRAEALQMSLAQARSEIDAGIEAARLAAAQREALDAMIARMQAEAADRDQALAQVQGDLSATQTELTEAEKRQAMDAAAMLALREQLTAAVGQVEETRAELEARTSALSETEKARLVELAVAEDLREKLRNSSAEVTAMTMALEEQRRKAEETLTLLAAAEAAKSALEQANAGLQAEGAENLSEAEKQRIALAQANRLLAEQEALSAESQREVALLNQQTGELRKQLNALQGVLDESKARDAEAQVQIEALGTNLNTALARVASEQRKVAEEQRRIAEFEAAERARLEAEATDLRRYRSEFFARVGEVLGGREGVQVVGDRFVFSSEVLFEPASAVLGTEGRAQIAEVAAVIREVADEIPPEIDWILRVDGHTDGKPLSGGGEFSDNWELSQARALSVVKYLIDFEGIPASRLAATGFGEFQPVDTGTTPEALARNRRIELKFTER